MRLSLARLSFVSIAFATMLAIGLSTALPAYAQGAGEEVDTEHIFGFTEGSDLGKRGEKEGEIESGLRFGKRTGSYFTSTTAFFYKYSVTDDFRVAPTFAVASHAIHDVAGLDNRNDFTLEGAGAEIRYRLMNRENAPFGFTLAFEPGWSRADETSGGPVRAFSAGIEALIDKELVHDSLFAAVNLAYEPEWAHDNATGEPENTSKLMVSGALTARLRPGLFLGGELRYERQYEGVGLDKFVGDALFIGPTMFVKFSKDVSLTVAWNAQVAGHAAGEPGTLNLTDFERHQVLLRLSIDLE